jgi:transcriptional regulator with XRE-family HTH domain
MTLYYVSLTLPATILGGSNVPPADDEFRARLREVLTRSGLSMRALSAALGRDPGYVAALLDPSRPSRARPTPADLLRASDATGIPIVELLETLWGIARARLAHELARDGLADRAGRRLDALTAADRAEVTDFVDFLASRHGRRGRSSERPMPSTGRQRSGHE